MSNKFKHMILRHSESAKEALKIINTSDLKFALVVDDNNKLIGTITDGDIRRFLLDGHKINSNAALAMNSDPIIGNQKHSALELKELMQKNSILAIPILDSKSRVVDIEIFNSDDVIQKTTHQNPVFLMAGGLGTRLQPLTDDIPKPMLQVGGKPLLEIILKNFIDHGFVNFYISVQYLPETIMDYFKDGQDFGVSIKYIREEQPLGTGGALGLLPKEALGSPIIVMNGDILTSVDFQNLLRFHQQHDGVATMCVRDYEFQVPFGVIEGEGSEINYMIEKPIHSCQVNAGIYVINSEIIDSITINKRVDMTDILNEQMSEGRRVHMFPIHEYWLDIGRLEDFNKAQIDYSKK
jgi:dTDP-glucose pyrophosphorylase